MTPLNDKALEAAVHTTGRPPSEVRAAVTAYLKADDSGWCSDMNAAPRDRDTKIDLWLMSRLTGRQWRMTDCYWGRGWQRDENFICGKWYYENGAICFDPLCEDEESTVATHWSPLPEPPGGKGG